VTYQARLNEHLVQYKKSQPELATLAPGTFLYHGSERPYDHILPLDEQWSNLLEPARTQARRYLAKHPGVTLHRHFNHLNSSQAFTFNLFLPFFYYGPKGSSALLRALGQSGEATQWELERVPVPGEDTNIDVFWHSSIGLSTFCEVKLSEADFGSAPNDKAHQEKLTAVYFGPLAGRVEATMLEPATFFAHYQLLRNLWHIADFEDARLIFLLPKANERIWNDATTFRQRVSEPLRERVGVIAIEQVISSLCEDTLCPDSLRQYAQMLQIKYIP
jgi:hypothetical protein